MNSHNSDVPCIPNMNGNAVENKTDISTSNDQNGVDSSCGDFAFSTTPNFEDIRQILAEFVKERNWGQFRKPMNLLLAMIKEVGEVAELFQWKENAEEGLHGWPEQDKAHLAQELSDVFIYLISLSEKCHVDLPSAVLEKIKQNGQKYPASKVWGSSKKYTEYQ